MAEAERPVPELPGYWRFGWMVFMQPLRLHELFVEWGVEPDSTWWNLCLRVRERDAVAAGLLRRVGFWQFGGAAALGLASVQVSAALIGAEPFWGLAAVAVAINLLWSATVALVPGVALGLVIAAVAPFSEVQGGSGGFEIVAGVLSGIGFAAFLSVLIATHRGSAVKLRRRAVVTLSLGLVGAAFTGVGRHAAFGVAFGFSFWTSSLGLHSYAIEAPWSLVLSRIARFGVLLPPTLSRLLPHRHNELIHFPLPGLRTFIVHAAQDHPDLARTLITEAAASVGQVRPARQALAELQARELEQASRERHYSRVAALDLQWVPTELAEGSPLAAFKAAARDLDAASTSANQHNRQQALVRARRTLEAQQAALLEQRRPSPLERLLRVTTRTWLDAVANEQARLEMDRRERPQIPTPFQAGRPLTRQDQALFRGRRDLARIIDQDIARDRAQLVLLQGQRRMGKSSLLNMLPTLLGTGTRVEVVDFQRLSGSKLRSEPHRLLSAQTPDGPWGNTLEWLRQQEAELGETRLLYAIDEVEQLEDGIRAGWASTDFLDFLRAAAAELTRTRFLLVSAVPLVRLGPHWPDRLITATNRQLGVLELDQARRLVTEPMMGFPDIYPPGGVDRILAETGRHPYLLQLVCDRLCRDLNHAGRTAAAPDDVEAAIDGAFSETNLFTELWQKRDDKERRVLRALALGRPAPPGTSAIRSLLDERFLVQVGDDLAIAVPMFATWIAERA